MQRNRCVCVSHVLPLIHTVSCLAMCDANTYICVTLVYKETVHALCAHGGL